MAYSLDMESQRPWVSVIETRAYETDAAKLLTEEERDEVVAFLARNPTAGVVMKETGGVRKVRLALEGRGKSGGARVIYFFHNDTMPIYLLAIFAKNEKANLAAKERGVLRKFCKAAVEEHRKKGG